MSLRQLKQDIKSCFQGFIRGLVYGSLIVAAIKLYLVLNGKG